MTVRSGTSNLKHLPEQTALGHRSVCPVFQTSAYDPGSAVL